ncbi:hypothetical protein HDV05_007840 [Chytridiales sp. JEL 0842]|nr:hypothetical protein HDV05_007840 [Chytridiales sp. JEL 0842]
MTRKAPSKQSLASLKAAKASAASSSPASKPAAVSQRSLQIKKALLDWFEQENITYDEELVDIQVRDFEGEPVFCVRSKRSIEEGMTIASIPKVSVLSIKNCGVAPIIEQAELGGTLGLAVALMFELHQGKVSPWAPYLESIPYRELIPIFWTEDQQALLEGTELEDEVVEFKAALVDDFTSLVAPLIVDHPDYFRPPSPSQLSLHATRSLPHFHHGLSTEDVETLQLGDSFSYWLHLFLRSSSLVSSRAFDVDSFHGTSMVPFADLFNHKTGAEHVHIETEGEVCPLCGAPGECNCFADEEEQEGADGCVDENCKDTSCCSTSKKDKRLEPVTLSVDELRGMSIKTLKSILEDWGVDTSTCVEKHDLVSKIDECCRSVPEVEVDEDGEPIPTLFSESEEDGGDSEYEEDEDEDMEDIEIEDSLDMTLIRPAKANVELFNTYGSLPNSALLSKYAFTEPNNQFDTVRIGVEPLLEICVERLGESRVDERVAFWTEVGRGVVRTCIRDLEKEMQRQDEGSDYESDNDEEFEEEGEEEEEEGGLEMDDDSFHIDSTGHASPHLLTFLHLIFLDPTPFNTFTKDAETLHKYVGQIVRSSGDSWNVTSIQTQSNKKRKQGNGVKTSPSPLLKNIHSVLAAAIEKRGRRYLEAKAWQEEEKGADGGVRKWVKVLREGEMEVLKKGWGWYGVRK